MTARGIKNNNPGNLNFIAPPHEFKGQVGMEDVPLNAEGKPEYTARFGRYDTVHNGIRALAVQLRIDFEKLGRNTITKLVETWAPKSDGNDPVAYAKAVVEFVNDGIRTLNGEEITDENEVLGGEYFNDALPWIVEAITHVENGGNPYSQDEVDNAVDDAREAKI